MPSTRSKRAAAEPAAVEPAKKRQSKRVKKETPYELEPEPEPVEPMAPKPQAKPEPLPSKEAERTLPGDTPIDEDDDGEHQVQDFLKEEPRASDLYLDTVSNK